MEFEPNTERAPDGTIGPTQLQHELAVEWFKALEQISALEDELRATQKAGDAVRNVNEQLRATFRKLTEIERQQRKEQARKNMALFPERYE